MASWAFLGSMVSRLTALVISSLLFSLASVAPCGAASYLYAPFGLAGIAVINVETAGRVGGASGGIGGIAVHPSGDFVYTGPNTFPAGPNGVSVIDTRTLTTVAVIAIPGGVSGVALNSAGTRLYVASSGSNSLAVIDTATNAVTTTIPLGGPAGDVHVIAHPSGDVYVANQDAGSVSIVDTQSNAVVTSIAVGGNPFGMAFDPSGTFLYVNNRSSNEVVVIRAATRALATRIALPPCTAPVIGAVAVHPDGSKVYASSCGAIAVIDARSHSVVGSISGVSPWAMDLDALGTVLFAPVGSDIVVIDTVTNAIIGSITPGFSLKAMSGRFVGPVVPPERTPAVEAAARPAAALPTTRLRFTAAAYELLLGRVPQTQEIAAWLAFLEATRGAGAKAMLLTFFESPEFLGHALTPRLMATLYYQAILGREPDRDGLGVQEERPTATLSSHSPRLFHAASGSRIGISSSVARTAHAAIPGVETHAGPAA